MARDFAGIAAGGGLEAASGEQPRIDIEAQKKPKSRMRGN